MMEGEISLEKEFHEKRQAGRRIARNEESHVERHQQ
jgi:hypothetical protein